MRVVIVGAGAVGQVYGTHLQRGGAQVTYFVREVYRDELARGLTLYPLNRPRARRWEPVEVHEYELVTAADEVREGGCDQLWLALSSTALRRGTWLKELVEAAGPAATLVSLQAGLEDRDLLLTIVPPTRLVQGMITFSSYLAPLPGDPAPRPGMAYWFPPLSPNLFSGPAPARDAILETLRRGGMPVRRHRDVSRVAAIGSSLLMPLIAALEEADWRFGQLARGPLLRLGCEAAREALVIAAAKRSEPPYPHRHLIRPLLVRSLLALAPRVTPFGLEALLQAHFTKVGDQTRFYLDRFIALGATHDLPTEALETLRRHLPDLP